MRERVAMKDIQEICGSLVAVLRAATLVFVAACLWSLTGVAVAADVSPITSWTTGTTGPSRTTSGDDRLLIFTAGMEDGATETVTSVTYGGQALTEIIGQTTGSGFYGGAQIFYLDEAGISAATSNTFSVTWSGNVNVSFYAARMYENVDQTTPIRDSDQGNSPSSSPNPITTPAMTVVAGDYVVAAAQCGNQNSYTWNNSFTEGTDSGSGSAQHSTADKLITSSGTQVASATNGGPNRQVILGAVLQSVPEVAEIFYVRPDGNDTNSGTGSSASEAWATLAAAVDKTALGPADIVYVMTGTYTGEITPSVDGSSSQPIQFIADTSGAQFGTAGAVTITTTGGNEVFDLNDDDYLEFVGFTIQAVDNGSGQQAIELDNSDGIAFRQCEIYDADRHGVDVGNNSSLELENCLIRDNESDGIRLSSGTLVVMNCTIVNSGSDGIEQDGGSSTITNSIIANNSSDGLDRDGGTMTHTYNCVFGSGDQDFEGVSQATGEITSDPLFTSASDFHLLSSSPCIDTGTASGSPPNVDLENVERPAGSGYDMGCYEFRSEKGHWALDETSGTTAADSSGAGNDGTLSGTTFTSSSVSVCPTGSTGLSLDGTNDYVDLPDLDFDYSGGFSIAMWIKPTATPSTHCALLGISNGQDVDDIWFGWVPGTGLEIYISDTTDGGTTRWLDDLNDPTLDVWHHVAVTVDGSGNATMYRNGISIATGYLSLPANTNRTENHIGDSVWLDHFEGEIDDVRFEAGVYTAAEVSALYGLLAHWKFDETSGTTFVDSSGNGHDGAFAGGTPTWVDGKVNNAVDFDTSGDYADTDANFTPPATGTIAFWMKVDGAPSARERILGLGGDWEIRHEPNGELTFDINGEGGSDVGAFFHSNTKVTSSSRWYHVAAVFDDVTDTFEVYIDGVLDNSGTNTMTAQSANILSFGTRTGSTEYWVGKLDEVQIFDRMLCSDEIQEIYSSAPTTTLRIIRWLEQR
ncbi:MAG: hypothetical protein DWQ35_02475 [Planctomycetota bacterium]|nr:MAG: hypothetical protein DWQ35_02475 [Planctomycetota bacterium]REK22488.1 MAG: hypothetical protein DWQ42_16990 [Planctomycetota bacterium]REK47130.1 MAG: hypothetical protein DWQ46_04975 [Planctomycetota bacterium]